MLQQLLHRLKYKGNYRMGQVFGEQMGNVFKQSGFMVGIDMIIPVPLHKKKLKVRGYNQSEHIAIGLSQSTGVEVEKSILLRTVHTESQTRKGRFERWENVSNIFTVANPELLNGKHVLIIDDVVTTGATLEACVQALLQNSSVKVSVATVGYADF
jgi:ComF family protein